MELEAAALLIKLMKVVKATMNFGNAETYYAWSDSQIALAWLAKEPSNWKTFVANRVSKVREANWIKWGHVSGKENPADLGSRGVTAQQLLKSKLWFGGPAGLVFTPENWPQSKLRTTVEEAKIMIANVEVNRIFPLFKRCSSYQKMVRVIAYCLRVKTRMAEELTGNEIVKAEMQLIELAQKDMFSNELKQLSQKKPITNNKIKSLSPFINEYGLMRVGGRLQLSELSYDEKHPIILDSSHPIVTRL